MVLEAACADCDLHAIMIEITIKKVVAKENDTASRTPTRRKQNEPHSQWKQLVRIKMN
jgi:hypothetical protein